MLELDKVHALLGVGFAKLSKDFIHYAAVAQ